MGLLNAIVFIFVIIFLEIFEFHEKFATLSELDTRFSKSSSFESRVSTCSWVGLGEVV